MRDSERRHRLLEAQRLVGQMVKEISPLITTLRQLQGGFPSSSIAGGGRSGGSTGSPTVAAAERDDPARRAERRLDELIEAVHVLAGDLDRIRDAWLHPLRQRPTVKEPGCRLHARLGAWEPVERDGRCWWCYDWWLAHDRTDPPEPILRARMEGRRITTKLVEEVMARRPRRP